MRQAVNACGVICRLLICFLLKRRSASVISALSAAAAGVRQVAQAGAVTGEGGRPL